MAEELIELGRACGKGKIRRRGYVTKRGVRVPAACVVDKGAPGKTAPSKRWFPKGVSIPGWSKEKTSAQRHTALNNLTEKKSCKRVLADLNAIANVTADQETKKKMRSDRRWLKEKGACKI